MKTFFSLLVIVYPGFFESNQDNISDYGREGDGTPDLKKTGGASAGFTTVFDRDECLLK